jgi:pseudaminic acid synthase
MWHPSYNRLGQPPLPKFNINNRAINSSNPTYIIAELSCNHNQNKETAIKLIEEAHKAGADAIKLQTYTQDTMTIDCSNAYFTDCLKGTLWEGETLYQLYSRAYTPWEWTKELKEYANSLGMDLFSSPFDTTAVDFLETLNVPAYKIASFEIVDHVLIKRIAQTGKPVIISSGMATFEELQEAIELLRKNGCTQICMLKCTSAYPATPSDANLTTMKDMSKKFNVVTGLSDHTLGIEVPIAVVALGGCVIEKHFTLSRESGSPDDAFSLIPSEFKQMVESVRIVEQTLGKVTYGGVEKESSSKKFRKSLFVVEDIAKGEPLTNKNIRPIRPADGMHTKYYYDVLGKTAVVDIKRGTPLQPCLFHETNKHLNFDDIIELELKEAKAEAAVAQQLFDVSHPEIT